MLISFIISVGLDVFKPRMAGFKTKTIFMSNYICVQEDGTTSQFKCDTISDEKPVPLLVSWYLTNCMVLF